MTKTLTKQWREGTLGDGWYYLDYDTQEIKVEIKDGRMYMDGIIVNRHLYGDDIDLMTIKGSVPSYDEHKRLKKKLEIALSVLGQIAMFSSDKTDAVQCAKAIKDINEVR